MSANNLYPLVKYQVQEGIYDAKSMLDEQNFYHQRQGAPAELTKRITYILGDYNKNYPISSMTLGGVGYGNGTAAVELPDIQYTYPVMGRMNKASVVLSTEYQAGDKPGIGHSSFYATFSDNWIKRYYVIQSENGTQAYVQEDPEPNPQGGYRYKLQLDPAGSGDYCALTDLTAGTRWIELFTAVAESESRNTESKMVMPGLFKNQMGLMRAGFSWAGNSANKVMKISVTGKDGQPTEMWMDYFMWQFENRWMEECEHLYWYNRYNRAADGTIALKDLFTGKIIPRGSGILEQITNKSTYSTLSLDTLTNKVGDALFGQADTGGMNITLFTGTGGMREFDAAMRAAGVAKIGPFGAGNIADKFITGSGYNLALGGYFDTYYHIDGYTISVKKNPLYDMGRVALASPLHPKSGLPLESYRMTFLDTSDVDGGPNVRHVAEKGRAYLQGITRGMTAMPKGLEIMAGNSDGNILSTMQDKAEYGRMKTAGIQIMRANRCFDLQCVAGL